MLHLQRLRALHQVARHGSIGAAAAALHITPSAVSQQLTALEGELGFAVVARNGRGVVLTEAGRTLAFHAEVVFDQLAMALAEIERLRGGARGTVRLAAFPSAMTTLVADAIGVLGTTAPEIDVRITEVEPNDAVRLLESDAVDIALVHSYDNLPRVVPSRLSVKHVLDDRMFLALPAGHPQSGSDTVDIAALRKERWITPGATTICFEHVQRACGAAGFVPDVAAHCTEYSTTLALVRAGVGVALVPALAVADRSTEGIVIRPPTPSHERRVNLLLSPAASGAVAVVADEIARVATSVGQRRAGRRHSNRADMADAVRQ